MQTFLFWGQLITQLNLSHVAEEKMLKFLLGISIDILLGPDCTEANLKRKLTDYQTLKKIYI